MTLPIKVANDLLINCEDLIAQVNPNNIFMIDVPEDYQKLDKLPIIRINQINDYQEGFASNMPFSMVISIQIDVWSTSIKELNNIQEILDKLMAQNGWSQYSGGIDKDPDFNNTPRLYRRYRTTQQIDFN
ncbi:hypothetical protein [Heyndrickxia ginsengihumi]|uniref:hypothetical protein n=1 Tax=Heyndrickxia ginsengihumi TaxID=363870 RepID=UPI000472C413|nr:hypothetical protein [Heyndrickxia ginsengihumi]